MLGPLADRESLEPTMVLCAIRHYLFRTPQRGPTQTRLTFSFWQALRQLWAYPLY